MKQYYFILSLLCVLSFTALSIATVSAQISPHPSAVVDMESRTKGLLIPRHTTAERLAISNPATGLLVYDEDHNSFWYFDQQAWREIGAAMMGCSITNVLNHGAVADRLTDNTAVINACIQQLNQIHTVNGVNLGWEMCIPKNVRFDFDLLNNLPEDYIIHDNSTFDWLRPTPLPGADSTYWTAQTKKIIHTSNPGMKNANEEILVSNYHPGLVIENRYDYGNPQSEDFQASVVFSSGNDRKWRVGMGAFNKPDFVIAGRTPAPQNALTTRMNIIDDFGNFGFNSFAASGIDYQFGDCNESNPLNFKFLGAQNTINWLFHHNGNASVSSSRISFEDSGKIKLLQSGNYGTTFGENQTIYGFRKEVLPLDSATTYLSKTDNNKIITNSGATASISLVLPVTTNPGNHLRVVVTENQSILIYPRTGDQFRALSVTSLQAATPGASIELYSVRPGIWELNVIQGTWY